MPSTRRVAIIIDLAWAFQHHHGIFVGTQRYAQDHENWDCVAAPFADPELTFPGTDLRYDGIIARATPQLAAAAEEASVPLVNVFRSTRAKNLPTVIPDRDAAGRMAAEHLLARGFRNFAHLGYARDRSSRSQLAGYRSTLREAGFDCDVYCASHTVEEKEGAWQKYLSDVYDWVDSWPTPIGVCATFDLQARYIANVCRQKGLDVPGDVAIVGTNNEPVICLQPEPTLSSIDIGFDQVGYVAAELLDKLMDGEEAPSEPIRVAPKELVPRRSTDVFAIDDPVVSRALRFIAENGHLGIHVEDVAQSVATTRRTLERRFRNVLGRTIAEELLRLRLERVKRQLVETDVPIKIIARQSGFINGKQLGKSFSRVVGMSPQEYRTQRQTP